MATATAQTTHAVTDQKQSTLLVQAMLRIAVNTVAFARNLFPESHFKHINVVGSLSVHKLLPCDTRSRNLLNWLEHGVHHALSNRYLKTMSLCVTDKDKEHALEEYIFDVEYDEGDTATISVGAQQGSGTRAHMPQRLTADSKPKEAGCTMVRKLIQLMGTLEPVPDDHNILVKLTYTERTPDHYEPPCFVPSTPHEQSLVCPAGSFHNECGKMSTGFHAMSMRMASMLDKDHCAEKDGTLQGTAHSRQQGLDVDGKGAEESLQHHAAERASNDAAALVKNQAIAGTENGDVYQPENQKQNLESQHQQNNSVETQDSQSGDEQAKEQVTEHMVQNVSLYLRKLKQDSVVLPSSAYSFLRGKLSWQQVQAALRELQRRGILKVEKRHRGPRGPIEPGEYYVKQREAPRSSTVSTRAQQMATAPQEPTVQQSHKKTTASASVQQAETSQRTASSKRSRENERECVDPANHATETQLQRVAMPQSANVAQSPQQGSQRIKRQKTSIGADARRAADNDETGLSERFQESAQIRRG